jgi:hydrogenase maturation protease
MTVLVGGVSELFQGDLDLGRLAVERLRGRSLGPDVLVEDLHYGAVAVAQRLQELGPEALVLVAAVRRDRTPGTVTRTRVVAPVADPARIQAAVGDAVTGYVHVDLVVEVAAALGALPSRTVAIEVEPERAGPGEGLSPAATAGLETALDVVRAELSRLPLLRLADELRPLVMGPRLAPSPALTAVHRLLDELDRVDRDSGWGATFALRDRLRLAIAADAASEGMDHRDWGLWWALVEELDRLQALETVTGQVNH